MVYYIADTHFGHTGIIDLCHRPFESVDEMEMIIIESWNGKVGRNDTVYIIGDLFYRHEDPESVLRQLGGKKRLIIGNRDGAWLKKLDPSRFFLSVDSFAEVSDGKRKLVLCHYPLMTWNHELQSYMVHGHIHNNRDLECWPLIKNNPRLLNAGVDVNGFWPVTFEEMVINNECFKEGLEIGEDFDGPPPEHITRVIVAGGRDFDDYAALRDVLDKKLDGLGPVEIVSGHARGADLLGERYAEERGIPCAVFPADRERLPLRAGFIRNTQMLKYAAQEKPLVIVFWDAVSHGTKDMIDKAKSTGIECVIIEY